MESATKAFNVAVVGSGPAGLFCVEELLRLPRLTTVTVFERLPLPFGLVRFGVSPDHPHTRRVSKLFEQVLAKPGVTLRTGVTIGKDITIEQLRRDYDAVVIATGAEEDRKLTVPGENLPHVIPSTAWAGWINGNPDFAHVQPDLSHPVAVIIGNGNVALDAVRVLGRPAADLKSSDISPAALAALESSSIQDIFVLGRRGPHETSFGESEIAEVAALFPCRAETAGVPHNGNESYAVLKAMSAPEPRCTFLFHRTVVRFESPHRIVIDHNGHEEALEAGLIIKAIGHRAVPLPGLPFDTNRCVIPTQDHRIVIDGKPAKGLYAAGWVKRGARGLIGHNRKDAMETVKAIAADAC